MSANPTRPGERPRRIWRWIAVIGMGCMLGLVFTVVAVLWFFPLESPETAQRRRAEAARQADWACQSAVRKQAVAEAVKPVEKLGGQCGRERGKGSGFRLAVDLSHWRGRDEDLRLLRAFLPLDDNSGAAVTLSLTMPPSATDASLSHIAQLTNLWSLDLTGTAVTDAGMEHLRGMKKLTILTLSDTAVDDEAVRRLDELPKLAQVSVIGTRVTPAGIVQLREALKNRDLVIRFSGGHVFESELWLQGTAGDKLLHDLTSGTQYKRIVLEKAPISDSGLSSLREQEHLEELGLHSPLLTDAGLEHLRGLHSLKRLWLFDTPITDAGLESIVSLHELESLDLAGTALTDAGLGQLRQYPYLEDLRLARTQVGDEGLRHLPLLKQLRRLNLDSTKTTDAGLVHLSALDRLEHLSLKHTRVQGPGLGHLKTLKALRELDLEGTQVSVASAEELQKHIPGAWINLTSKILDARPTESPKKPGHKGS